MRERKDPEMEESVIAKYTTTLLYEKISFVTFYKNKYIIIERYVEYVDKI